MENDRGHYKELILENDNMTRQGLLGQMQGESSFALKESLICAALLDGHCQKVCGHICHHHLLQVSEARVPAGVLLRPVQEVGYRDFGDQCGLALSWSVLPLEAGVCQVL